ncbi:MAG TPA: hypothetical protein VEQ60_27000 [Longimicrobium sp.]|nr:hypothetical protein [Longimicrobium sp.]
MQRWLHRVPLTVLAIMVACAPVAAQQTAAPAAASPAADSADVASPEALVTALYDVISGPAGEARDWDRFRSLFLPGARLVYSQTLQTGEVRLHPMTVEDFIRIVTPVYASGGGFWERDIGHRMDRFGNVVHVFTAYETRRSAPDGPVVARGINSVQLVRHEGRWWVVSLAWDTERPGNPLPPELPASPPE